MKRETLKDVRDRAASPTPTFMQRKVARDILDSDARQRAELRRLRAFVRGCSTYDCSCGDGDICVGCAARQVLASRRGHG